MRDGLSTWINSLPGFQGLSLCKLSANISFFWCFHFWFFLIWDYFSSSVIVLGIIQLKKEKIVKIICFNLPNNLCPQLNLRRSVPLVLATITHPTPWNWIRGLSNSTALLWFLSWIALRLQWLDTIHHYYNQQQEMNRHITKDLQDPNLQLSAIMSGFSNPVLVRDSRSPQKFSSFRINRSWVSTDKQELHQLASRAENVLVSTNNIKTKVSNKPQSELACC